LKNNSSETPLPFLGKGVFLSGVPVIRAVCHLYTVYFLCYNKAVFPTKTNPMPNPAVIFLLPHVGSAFLQF